MAFMLVGLLGLPSAQAEAKDTDELAAAVDRAFRPLLAAYDVPGMAVAVTVDGRSRIFCYGVASKESRAPVTESTLFEIGSLSKTFNVTLAAYAQARGKLSLLAHPGLYMPSLRGSAIDKASLMELATFTAGGLPLQFPDTVTTPAEMTSYLAHWTPSASPGTQRLYSNVSIGLVGHLTALALSGRYADLLKSDLLVPMGLLHTFIDVPPAQMAAYAWGYKDGAPTRMKPGLFDAQAYGIKSDAADMIRFVQDNITPDKLPPPIRRAIDATHVGHFDIGVMVQGLGWEQYPFPVPLARLVAGNAREMITQPHEATRLVPPRAPTQPTLFDKTGSTNGFGAYVAFVPARRIGIVMLANQALPVSARVTAAYAVLEALAASAR